MTVEVDEKEWNSFKKFTEIEECEEYAFTRCVKKGYQKDNEIFIGEDYVNLINRYGEREIFYLVVKWRQMGIFDFGITQERGWIYVDRLFGKYMEIYNNIKNKINYGSITSNQRGEQESV